LLYQLGVLNLYIINYKWFVLCTGDQRLTAQEAKKCQRSYVYFQRGVPVKTGAEFLVCTVSIIKDLKEEGPCMTEGRRKKGEMVG
jgi:hypothetical protein